MSKTPDDQTGGEVTKKPTNKAAPKKLKIKTPDELWAALRDIDRGPAKEIIVETLQSAIESSKEISSKYNVLFLWTNASLDDFELNRIYRSIKRLDSTKGILLIVHSPGGSAESAYLISKALKNSSSKPFVVAVPRRAKSAATLLSMGAQEIHMSQIAELGPIDPQLHGMPVLGMQQALEHVSTIAEQHKGASKMLAAYLAKTMAPVFLGYSSRVAESAQQYAERLLQDKASHLPPKQTPITIANSLVYEYKNHGFVIDWEEAQKLFGSEIVQVDTDEIKFALELHEYLEDANLALTMSGTQMILAGEIEDIVLLPK